MNVRLLSATVANWLVHQMRQIRLVRMQSNFKNNLWIIKSSANAYVIEFRFAVTVVNVFYFGILFNWVKCGHSKVAYVR